MNLSKLYTYEEVLELTKKSKYILDASNIDNPYDYQWYIMNNIFYPYLN